MYLTPCFKFRDWRLLILCVWMVLTLVIFLWSFLCMCHFIHKVGAIIVNIQITFKSNYRNQSNTQHTHTHAHAHTSSQAIKHIWQLCKQTHTNTHTNTHKLRNMKRNTSKNRATKEHIYKYYLLSLTSEIFPKLNLSISFVHLNVM